MFTKTHLLAALLTGTLSFAAGQSMAQTSGNTMPMKDSAATMKSDAMKPDAMKSDAMKADAMKKDTMKKDGMTDMKSDGMKKDAMK